MATGLELLQGAQLRLEQQQVALQSEMRRMEEALTAKLDAVLATLGDTSEPAEAARSREQADCAAVVDEGVPCTDSGVVQRAVPAESGERATRRVKLADLPHNNPAARSKRIAGDKFSGDRIDPNQMFDSGGTNDPYSSLVYDERSAKAVELVRYATLWVGDLPEVALRGLSTQGSGAVSDLFPGRDVVAVTVRRKQDIGVKRKSWALVTFGTTELAKAILEESTPQRDAAALWKLGAAGATMIRRPSVARISSAEMAAAEEKSKTIQRKRRLTMTSDGKTFSLSVKNFSMGAQLGQQAGAMSNIVRSHILKATEACGEFAVTIVAAKTGKIVSLTVSREVTIIDVKRRLYSETQQFPPHLQRLRRRFAGSSGRVEDLEDHLTLGECGLFPGGPKLELLVKTSLQDLCCVGHTRREDSRSDEEKQEDAEKQRTVVAWRSDAVKGGYAVMSFIPGRKHYWTGMTLHPDGDARQRWDFLVAMLVVLSVALIPLTVAFQEELDARNLVGFSVVERAIDALFCLHIILNFRTAIVHECCLITDARAIAWNYCKGWFWMDLVASFPFDAFMHTEEASSKASGGFRLARLVRLGRLVRVASFARMRLSSNGMRLLKLVFYLVTLAHWLGCAWYFVSKIESFRDDAFSVGGQDHMMDCRSDGGGHGAVQCEPIDDLWALYIFAFRWGLASLASLGGDLRPATVPQAWLSILVNILGFYVTSYIMGQVYSIILNLDVANNHFISMMQDAENWFKLRQFPLDMREQINRYLVHNFDTTKGMDELQLLQSLPRRLRQDVQYYLNRELITSLPLLHGMDDRIVLSISDKLRREVCMPGDAIVKQGDAGDEMYFIRSGECECTAYGRGVVSVKQAGMYFGEVALFSDTRRTATVTARTLCELMVLTKNDLDFVADIFSELKTSIKVVAEEYARSSGATPEGSLSKSMSRASFFSIDGFMSSSGSYDRVRGVGCAPEASATGGMVRAASSWDLVQQHAACTSGDSQDAVEHSEATGGDNIRANDELTHSTRPTYVDSPTPTSPVETKAVASTDLKHWP